MSAIQEREQFAAYCPCPRCGYVACHLMREPKPAPSAADIAYWENHHRTVAIENWGGKDSRIVYIPPRPSDESMFEVVRICKCGNEFGQK